MRGRRLIIEGVAEAHRPSKMKIMLHPRFRLRVLMQTSRPEPAAVGPHLTCSLARFYLSQSLDRSTVLELQDPRDDTSSQYFFSSFAYTPRIYKGALEMRLSIWLAGALVVSFGRAEQRLASIYVQPIVRPSTPPVLLAEVTYDTLDSSNAKVSAFEAPELPSDAELVRVGIYDPVTARWSSSTSVASVDNFGKGYAPSIVLSVDGAGNYLGVSLKGVRIDAGQTRDFGPQAAVVVASVGRQPELNKPVVLSPEGKKLTPEPEKTFLQKYVFLLFANLESSLARSVR
jgi:hypothetical protein